MGDTVVIDGEMSLLTALDADMSLLIPEQGECGIVTAFREYPAYTGPVEFTPSEEAQTIDAAGKAVLENLVIDPIPNNDGLITWDGSVITVS